MSLNALEPTNQRTNAELAAYIRETRAFANAIVDGNATTVGSTFNVENGYIVELADLVDTGSVVEEATTVTNATTVEEATTVTTCSGDITTATTVTAASGTITSATTVTDCSGTITSATTVTNASAVTNATNVTNCSAAQNVTNLTNLYYATLSGAVTTITTAYNSTINGSITNLYEVTDEIADADADTAVEVERTPDVDTIYLKAQGTDVIEVTSSAVGVSKDIVLNALSATYVRMSAATAALILTGGTDDNTAASIALYGQSAGTPNILIIKTAGSERLRVDASGNVGIGKTSGGAELDVNGEVECTALDVNGNADISGTASIGDTLTLSKASGTGLSVTDDAAIGGDLNVTGILDVDGVINGDGLDIDGTADISSTLDIGSNTTRRVAPAGTFVSASNGDPLIAAGAFDVATNVTEASWESVGPTGSGADNIWTVLDNVPTDARWIELKASVQGTDGAASSNLSLALYARKNGGTAGVDGDTQIAGCKAYSDSSGDAFTGNVVPGIKVPVDTSTRFQVYYTSSFTTDAIYLRLVGYGFNP